MADLSDHFMQILSFCMRRRTYPHQRGEVSLRKELVASCTVDLVLEVRASK